MTAICGDRRMRGAKLFCLGKGELVCNATAIVTPTGGKWVTVGDSGLWRANVAEVSTEVANPESRPEQKGTKAYTVQGGLVQRPVTANGQAETENGARCCLMKSSKAKSQVKDCRCRKSRATRCTEGMKVKSVAQE